MWLSPRHLVTLGYFLALGLAHPKLLFGRALMHHFSTCTLLGMPLSYCHSTSLISWAEFNNLGALGTRFS